MTDPETPEIRHEPERGRFVMELEGGLGTVVYELGDGTLDILSTFIPPSHRNRGLGERLVMHVLAYAREQGLQVIPTCPFVPRVLDLHPEVKDLVAKSS